MGLLDIATGGKASLPGMGPAASAGAPQIAATNPFSGLASLVGQNGGIIDRLTAQTAPQAAPAPTVAPQTPEEEYFGQQPSTEFRDAEEAGLKAEREKSAVQTPTIRQSVAASPNWAAERAGIFKGESGGDYDALFGFSNRPGKRFAGTKVTDMTVDEAINFARPSGPYAQWVKGQIGRVATPMGGFQIVGTTLRQAKQAMGLTGKERMTPQMQDELGKWIRANQGLSAWEGYRGPGDPNEFPAAADVVGRPPAMLSGIGSPDDPTLQAPTVMAQHQPPPDPTGATSKAKRKPLKGRTGKLFPNATAGGSADMSGGGGAERRSAPGVQMTEYKSRLKPELLKQLDRGNMLALLQSIGAQVRGGGTSV